MSEISEGTNVAEERQERAAEVNIPDLANLLTNFNRLLNRFAMLPQFEQPNLGFVEWSVLSMISNKSIGSMLLARQLGVSKQRVSQIIEALEKSSLIQRLASSDDGRKRVISLTPAGMDRLEKLNTDLQPLVASALKGREKAVTKASRAIRPLMRIGAPKETTGRETRRASVRQARGILTKASPQSGA